VESEKLDILVSFLGSYYRTGQEYLFECPKCNHEKRKLSVNIEKGVYKCWICGFSGLKVSKLVKRYADYSDFNKWQELDGAVDIASFDDLFGEKETKDIIQRVELPESFISLTGNNNSFQSRHARSYLKKRGITEEDILKWKIGFCMDGDYSGRICIPSFSEKGELNYFVARSHGSQFPKYKNPPVSRDIIFNDLYTDWDEPVVLVEGVFDAIVAGNAIPILGSVLKEESKLFQKIISKKATIYMALDPDAKKKEQRIINSLLEHDITVFNIEVSPYDDVGSMPEEAFMRRKKDAAVIDSTHYLYQCLRF
jgi:DNA primase